MIAGAFESWAVHVPGAGTAARARSGQSRNGAHPQCAFCSSAVVGVYLYIGDVLAYAVTHSGRVGQHTHSAAQSDRTKVC